MNTLSATTSLLAHSLVWALLYSLWQGLLLYGCLFILMKAIPGISARLKHYLSFGAFSAVFIWFADTWVEQYEKLKGVIVYITQSGADMPTSTTPVNVVQGAEVNSSLVSNVVRSFEHSFPIIIGIYIAGVAVMLIRFGVNVLQVRTLKNKGLTEAGAEWNVFLLRWQRQFDISRKVKLFLSDKVNVPMMLGVIKPVILIPIATMNHLDTEQVEAILLHELAHIKRHDYLLNIFQAIVETILFFNPFVWLISGIIRREREHCCDDLVVACSASPLPYARALAILEARRINENSLALAATGHKNQLFNRIKRIMEMKKSNINYSQLTIILVAIIALTFTVAMFTFTPSFAQKAKKAKNDSTTVKSSYVYKFVTVDSNGKRNEVVKTSDTPLNDDEITHADNVTVNVALSKDGKSKTETMTIVKDEKDDELADAMKEVVLATKEAAKAMASINMKEINKEVESAEKELDAVDWDNVNAEIKRALAEVSKELNSAKMHKDMSIQIKRELERSKAALEEAGNHLPKHKKTVVKVVADGGNEEAEIEEVAGTDYEAMLNKMQQEGLINRSSKFKIEKEKDELYINGEKQPREVFMKYHEYLKDKTVAISGSKNTLTISVND